MEEAKAALMKTAGGAAIAQQYIASSFARDIRAYIVGDKVAAAMLRHNESGDFRANVAQGGKADAYALNEAQAALAVKPRSYSAARLQGWIYCLAKTVK